MTRKITQRELRNESGDVMRALDAGEAFVVTRNGVAVGELTPLLRDRFTPKATVVAAFSNVPPIDLNKFRKSLETIIDQDSTPRG
jgi:antitoxin (DNA-binding transcriptional repressor) of toxin-antitoxin stability system